MAQVLTQAKSTYCATWLIRRFRPPSYLTHSTMDTLLILDCKPHAFHAKTKNGPQGSLENLRPTPEESLQLLWLAEVEYILGIACLQLAFAAAPKPSPSSPQPPVDAPLEIIPGVVPSKATVVANLTAAAGGRRPWGYGNGPFSGISATAKDIFEQDPGGSEERAGGASVGGDESRTIEQLEVSH